MIDGVVREMRQAREDAGVGRTEMAYRLDVDFSTIQRWETGHGKEGPPLWAVAGYSRVTGVPVAHLLGEETSGESMQAALLSALADRMRRFDAEFEDVRLMIQRLEGNG